MASRRVWFLIGLLTLFGAGVLSGNVVAQEDPMYNDGTNDIFEMLDRLRAFLLDALLKVGMVVILFGALLWFSAKNSADRADYGRWLVKGGAGMMVVSLAFTAVIALIEWIATGT